MSSFEQDGEMV